MAPKNLSAIELNHSGLSLTKYLCLPLPLLLSEAFSDKICLTSMATCLAESISVTDLPRACLITGLSKG